MKDSTAGGEAGQWQRGQQTANFRLTTAAYSMSLQASLAALHRAAEIRR